MGLALRCARWAGNWPTTRPPTRSSRRHLPDGRSASQAVQDRGGRAAARSVASGSDLGSAELGQGRAPVRAAAPASAADRPAGVVAREPGRRSRRRRRRRWCSGRRTGGRGASNLWASVLLSGRRARPAKRCLETIAARCETAQRDRFLDSSNGPREASAGKRGVSRLSATVWLILRSGTAVGALQGADLAAPPPATIIPSFPCRLADWRTMQWKKSAPLRMLGGPTSVRRL